MQATHEKGLSFNCNGKFHKNHKCKGQFLTLLDVSRDCNDLSEGPLVENNFLEEIIDDLIAIIFHALSRSLQPKTIRFQGSLDNIYFDRF